MRDEQIAKEIVQLLEEHSEHLNATVLSRLNTARQQAIATSPDAYDVNQQGA